MNDIQEETPKLVFVVPDENAPGYLDRMLAIAGFVEMFESKNITKSGFNDLIRFLSDYIKEPADYEGKVALLKLASEAEIKGLLEALSDNGKVNPTNGGS